MSPTARILLVDDRPENLFALEAILEPLGQELVRAESGEEALRRLLHDDYAAILLDVQMPRLDGFQTAELIKQRERTRHVPIIFLTALSKDAEHVFRGYESGAVDYITKPFDPAVLRAKVGGLHRALAEDGRAAAARGSRPGAGAGRARPRERGALPAARRRRAGDRLDDDGRGLDDVLQPALVRLHRARAGRRLQPDRLHPPRRRSRDARPVGAGAHHLDTVRGRVPPPGRARRLPVAPRPGDADARRERRDRRLGRRGHGHRRSAPGRGAAAVPGRGRLGPRQLARLRADARRRGPARRAEDRRLVHDRPRPRRRADPRRHRPRRPAEGGALTRALRALSARPRDGNGPRRRRPDKGGRARARDHPRAVRAGRRRPPARDRRRPRRPLLPLRAARRP